MFQNSTILFEIQNDVFFQRISVQYGQWVRVHSSQKESTKACIFHAIRSILQIVLFDSAPNLLTLHISFHFISSHLFLQLFIFNQIQMSNILQFKSNIQITIL